MKMNLQDFGVFLGSIPNIVSTVVYQLMGETNRIPRFDSVFRVVKAELKQLGYTYNDLTEEEKNDIYTMAKDVYTGMKEAGF